MGMCRQRDWDRSRDGDIQQRDRSAMPCRPHTWDRRGASHESESGGTVAVTTRDATDRVSDVDRERAAAVLSEAFRDGMLRVEEFDQRLSAVYAAQTVGDLDEAMADLHPEWLRELDEAEAAQRRAAKHRRQWRAEVGTYRRIMTLLVGIWLFTVVTNGGIDGNLPHFWPIWPMLGWGIPLFLGRPRRSTTPPSLRDRTMAVVR